MPKLNTLSRAVVALVGFGLCSAAAQAQVSLAPGGTYSQNFNTLATSGTTNPWTDNSTLAGWYSARAGGNAAAGPTATYVAGDGSSNAGAVYSFGTGTASDRALGSVSSGTPGTLCQALRIVNSGASEIASLDIGYIGEQWRNGGNTSAQPLAFAYRVVPAGTSFAMGCNSDAGWTVDPDLGFTSPTTGATAAPLDGNAAANRASRSKSLVASIAPGAEIWLRWSDINDVNNDHGLAIDDLSITANGAGPTLPTVSFVGSFVTAQEGGDGDANPMNFLVDVAPAPLPGSPVSFNIGVSGPMGRFTYAGPASLVVTDQTALPITITVDTVGNTVVQGDATVTVTLSGFTGTAAGQDDPISKDGTIIEDDLAPINVSVADVAQLEGDSGSTAMVFIVQLDAVAGPGGVSFDYSVVPGSAKADEDYSAPASGSGSIVAGSEATTIEIPIVGDLLGEFDESFSIVLSNVQGAGVTDGTAVGTILNDDRWYVWQIQGTGACSPLIDPCVVNANTAIAATVPVRAAIVTAIGPDGFAMEVPSQDDDGDLRTSNGIYVFTFAGVPPQTDSGQALAVGDLVEVTGGVKEFFGFTEVQVNSTRNAANSIVRLAPNPGLTLPTPVEFSRARGVPSRNPAQLSCPGSGIGGTNNDDTNFECFEGMRVAIADGVVSAPNQRFGSDLFAEVYVSPIGERGIREKGALFGVATGPSNAGAGSWDGNPEIIEMDADYLLPANAGLGIAGGTRFSAVGIIGFDFGDYEFWPTQLDFVAGSNQVVKPVPAAGPDELTIGSFNAFRFCDAIAGNTISTCAATVTLETDANRVIHERGQVSAYIRQVLRSPDVVGMQEVENLAILQALATQIAADGGPAYQAYLVEGNDVGGIDVGYLVNPARVSVVSVEQRLDDVTWNDPSGSPTATLHDRPPLLLTADYVGNGVPFRFQVINNHTRSRGGVETGDAESNRVRAKRFLQGKTIAELVQQLQTGPGTAGIPLLVIGDHNAYQFTDAFVDVVGLVAGTYRNDENTCSPNNGVTDCELPGDQNIVVPAMTNSVLLLDADEQYSYNFTENFGAIQGSTGRDLAVNQVLDHALFNVAAQPFVTGMAFGRANVDAPVQRFRVCNYRFRDATACPQGPGTWVPTGSSDHDGLVIYLSPPRANEIFANGFEG